MKILTILGARPQFIKAAVVSRAIGKHQNIEEIIVHTGQHYDPNMSAIFFEEMEIPAPKYNLEINGGGHGEMTGRMLEKIESIILKENPDSILVYGDTNSTLAGALAGTKLHKKIIHIEAGLRSFNNYMPEEINRSLTDRISNFLFCPTQLSVDNLKAEGITNNVILSGDVMQDSAIFYANKSEEKSTIINKLKLKEDFLLCTIHRQENTDNIEAMRNIINSLNNISKSIRVLCPLHPRTKKIISELNITPQFEIIDPVGYFDMLELLKNCTLVVTDSGGLQKEAYFFKKQCVTLREETEWVELVENGFNKLVGSDSELIEKEVTNSLNSQVQFGIELYGGGNASTTIANFLSELNA